MRTQSETSGVNARGTYSDLQEYDQKLKPSPLVPRKSLKLKKEGFMNEAFMRGFFDELEKNAALGALLGRGLAAGKGLLGKAAPQGGRLQRAGSWLGGKIKQDPMMAMYAGQQVLGGLQARRQAKQQPRAQQTAARSGQAPVSAKKPTGFMGGLGFGGAQ